MAAVLSPRPVGEPHAAAREPSPECEAAEARPHDATLLVEGAAAGKARGGEEPMLSLVSLNPRTAKTFDLVRGTLTVVHELPGTAASVRTVRVSCGRDPANNLVLSDSRASLLHFTVRVRAARGGFVALELLDQSSNGTWVNGRRIGRGRSAPLAPGDQILVLPASHVGRAAEVGYLLLLDARGAKCSGSPVVAANGDGELEELAVLPPSPKGVSVPRDLERDLRCGICADALFRCLTLVPCGHNFCTACLVRWRRRSHACPECRENVLQAVRNLSIDRVVETFLLAHPEAARSPSETLAMEAAEKDPSNMAMLRWLLRPGPSWAGHMEDPRSAPTPMRRTQEIPEQRRPTPEQRRPSPRPASEGSAVQGSTACVVS